MEGNIEYPNTRILYWFDSLESTSNLP